MKTKRENGVAAAGGFSLTELAVVMAVTVTLAVLLLPSWVSSNRQGQGAKCMADMRQLATAWIEYTSDNRGNLVPNGAESDEPPTGPSDSTLLPGGANSQWCPGRQDASGDLSSITASSAANIGYEYIEAGLLYPYVRNVHEYLCPADSSSESFFGTKYPHVRSRSMNDWLNPVPGPWAGGSEPCESYYKVSDLVRPVPSQLFVFIDENPISINDGEFICDPGETLGSDGEWLDAPACYHNGGSGLSFADGHTEIKRWTDPTLLTAVTSWSSPAVSKQNPSTDFNFLANASTYIK